MKNTKLNAALLLGGWLATSAVALACTPVPTPLMPALPAGPDGKLPVTYPYPAQPTPVPTGSVTPTAYPTPLCNFSYYGNTANMPSLNDAETDRVIGSGGQTGSSAPAWDAARTYSGGELVSYNGQTYKAKWWTQNDAPGNAYGPWELQQSASGPQAWDSTRVYNTGDQATYNGNLYQARWWTQGNAPGEEWGPWELRGTAPVATATPLPSSTPVPSGTPGNTFEVVPLPSYFMPGNRTQGNSRPATFNTSVQQVTGNNGEAQLEVTYSSYAPVTTVRYIATASCTVTTTSIPGTGTGSDAAPQYWELRMDGKPIGRVYASDFRNYPPRPIPVPALPTMFGPDGKCLFQPGQTVLDWYQDSGYGTTVKVRIARGEASYWRPDLPGHYLSSWACNGNLCRPSTLLWHTRMGTRQ
ncbi:carbohydrate-binding protein [Chitinilyticum litopenaei]|uniref:carbohydrate-binding protein n=1 Tax=Chitinilyticum litopenaei TaxID=1121276 RepID=UPI00040B6CF6|nr:carbohydrate-binding protein [Chitinilyticum litopenaei]